jgi:light-regulated signal transduction histidine kinase (bacteriophytochrome)
LQKELEITAANSARELAEARANFVEELQHKNDELESFCYSVSHDLRTPLRAIRGFSQLLLQDQADKLDADGQDHLRRICSATQRMSELIDDLLLLSRIGRAAISRERTDLSCIARDVAEELRKANPSRQGTIQVDDDLVAEADSRLVRVVFENLLGNAWKYSSKVPVSRIQVGSKESETDSVFFVCDNGAGFDMRYGDKLFRPFQRLHSETDFSGTGIGLATVHRIIERHGGRIWAESAVDQGATFYFTIPPAK